MEEVSRAGLIRGDQAELARRVGLSETTISKFLHGKRKVATSTRLAIDREIERMRIERNSPEVRRRLAQEFSRRMVTR